MKKLILSIFVSVGLFGCDRPMSTGVFPETPGNLWELNSAYDDVNSDLSGSMIHLNTELLFSTNRPNSSPKNSFQLILFGVSFTWDQKEDVLLVKISNPSPNSQASRTRTLKNLEFDSFSQSNEKGPYSFNETNDNLALLFSRDLEGIYSINVVTEKPVPSINGRILSTLRIMDESSNEMYPCFYGKEFIKGDVNGDGTPEKMLFSSDKDGQFDIYEVDIPSGMTPLEFLADPSRKEVKKLAINTDSNDHMPFVLDDKLVFASDRPGGLGGYDLYYSKRTADGWSNPVNFGHPINSEFDEYRPIVSGSDWFLNNLMIFSSDRPGGKGGFDLYYVGVSK